MRPKGSDDDISFWTTRVSPFRRSVPSCAHKGMVRRLAPIHMHSFPKKIPITKHQASQRPCWSRLCCKAKIQLWFDAGKTLGRTKCSGDSCAFKHLPLRLPLPLLCPVVKKYTRIREQQDDQRPFPFIGSLAFCLQIVQVGDDKCQVSQYKNRNQNSLRSHKSI